MYKTWRLPILVLLLAISGCITGGAVPISEVPFEVPAEGSIANESAKWWSTYFTFGDDIEAQMTTFIDSAQVSIYMAAYDLDLENVANALIRAYERGVGVMVIMDNRQAERDVSLYVHLLERGVPVVLDRSKSDFMHNKFIVVDGERTWTGSVNPTYNGVNRNNNNALIIESEELAENYIAECEEMWRQYELGEKIVEPTPNPCVSVQNTVIENYFAPEDHVEEKILSELESANSSIMFMTFTFTSDPIEKKLIEKSEEGVVVKGIFESRQVSRYAAYEFLYDCNIPVIRDKNGYSMHHKVFIIDNETTITGSFNPSKHADEENDENILIIHDPEITKNYLEEFEKLWSEWCN